MEKVCEKCKLRNVSELKLCSGCNKVYYCSIDCQKQDWKLHHHIVCQTLKNSQNRQSNDNENTTIKYKLNEKESKALIKLLRSKIINIYRILYFLDQKEADVFKQKNTYFHEQNHKDHAGHKQESGSQCCGTFFSKIYIPVKERSPLELCAGEVLDKHKLPQCIPNLLDFIAEKYEKIKQSGINDKLKWDNDTEKNLVWETLKQGCESFFQKEIKQKMLREQNVDSKQPMLLATPKTWEEKHPKIQLNFLPNSAIESLIKNNYAIIQNFTNNKDFVRNLYKELIFLERDGRFEEPIQEAQIRTDRILYTGLEDIEAKSFKNLHFIANTLSALPYELNKKTQICAQASELFQVSYFKDNKSLHQVHIDSSFDKAQDNGKKLTVLYFCNIDNDEKAKNGIVKIYKNPDNLNQFIEIETEMDSLVIFKSRIIPYEILENDRKRFIIRYWVNGPADYETKQF